MKKAIVFIGPIFAGFLVGFLGSLVQASSIAEWYPFLEKPALTPANSVFPVAWGVLYVLAGLSMGFILLRDAKYKRTLVTLFAAQLLLNFLWCLVFFGWRNPAAGLVIIVALLAILLVYAILAWSDARWSALLIIPYILWVAFATYLNAYIWLHN